jgi:signal transduction histidine kinase
LFSTGPDSAQARARVRYRLQGDRVVFPDLQFSLSAEAAQLRPFDPIPGPGPVTQQAIVEQYFPRIEAFRRDVAAGRTTGTQYFRQLRGLVVQVPGAADGYVVDIDDVLAHVNTKLADLSADAPFAATAWMGSERTALPPAGALGLQAFPFFAVVFSAIPASSAVAMRQAAVPYALSLLLLVTAAGSVFVYRAISHEARLARLRNDFVAAVSHEFRSPLSSILALGERLERVHDPEKLREYHAIIGRDARRLGALVTRLLDFAQIEEGQKVYARERVDLVDAARDAVDSCRHVARPDRIQFVGSSSAPLWVRADRTALHHSIQNVIENAAKYSPDDSPIVVACSSINGSHVVEVQDNGIGIPESEQARIFEKFYRGRQVVDLNVQGVGIGLALVKHVMDSHGGSVSVESKPGEGSRFSLRLPALETAA